LEGLSDKAIGDRYGMTGEGVAYRRKKYGISVDSKPSAIKITSQLFKETPAAVLSQDYYAFNLKRVFR
jgi:hypothetical protein